jgi:hypothetical protein
MGGAGPNGLDMKMYGDKYEFRKDFGVTAGAMYQYHFDSGVGLGAGAFLNETYFGAVSYSFGSSR